MKNLTRDVTVEEVTDLSTVWKEMKPLLDAHWEEVAAFKDDIKLSVDEVRYKELIALGVIRLWVCRNVFGEMCGYSAFVLQPNMHYQEHTFAVNDVIFIAPKYRHGTLAYQLVDHCEDQLKKSGVSVVTYHMKVYAPFHSLMETTGYTHLENLYGKKL